MNNSEKIKLAIDNLDALSELHPLQIHPLASYSREGLVLARCYLILLNTMDECDECIIKRYDDIDTVIDDLKAIKNCYAEGGESFRLLNDSIILLSDVEDL